MADGGNLAPTNRDVLNILESTMSVKDFSRRVREAYPCLVSKVEDNSIYTKAKRVQKKVKNLKKNKTYSAAFKVLEEPFIMVCETNFDSSQNNLTENEKVLNFQMSQIKTENKTLKRKKEDLEKENVSLKIDIELLDGEYSNSIKEYGCISEELLQSLKSEEKSEKEIEELKLSLNHESCKLDALEKKYYDFQCKLKSNFTRNVTKKLKRRDSKIENLEEL